MTDQPHAVLLLADDGNSYRDAASVVAANTGEPMADALHRIVRTGGFAVERADCRFARRLVEALSRAGVAAIAAPQTDVVNPPRADEVRHARIGDRGLSYVWGMGELGVPWESIVWIDLVELLERKVVPEVRYDPFFDRNYEDNERPLPKIVEERPLALELVTVKPMRRLRFRNDRFAFAATGLKMQPNKRQNAIALAIAVGSRAKEAEFGPGMEWLRDGTPPRPERFDDHERYDRKLRARLTRLRCES